MSRPDWRDPADYESLRFADAVELAGEFLKRNPDYERDRERLTRRALEGQLSAAERDAFALAWGVRFRGPRRAPGMDAAGAPQRSRRGPDTAGACGTVASR